MNVKPAIATPIRTAATETSGEKMSTDPPQPVGLKLPSPIEIEQIPNLKQSIDMAWLRQRVLQAVKLISAASGREVQRIGILIADDQRMIELDRQHRGVAATTDVLSFDLSGDRAGEGSGGGGPIEADIAICADEAAHRAAELGHSLERELLLYAIHGLLHCAGHDDQDEQGYRAMHAEEDRILRVIGVGATFDRGATESENGAEQP